MTTWTTLESRITRHATWLCITEVVVCNSLLLHFFILLFIFVICSFIFFITCFFFLSPFISCQLEVQLEVQLELDGSGFPAQINTLDSWEQRSTTNLVHSLRTSSVETALFKPNNFIFVFPAFAQTKLEIRAATCPIAKLMTETSRTLLQTSLLTLLLLWKKVKINFLP